MYLILGVEQARCGAWHSSSEIWPPCAARECDSGEFAGAAFCNCEPLSTVTRYRQVTDAMAIHGGYGVNATEFFTDLWIYDFSGNRWIMLYSTSLNLQPVLSFDDAFIGTASGTIARVSCHRCWITRVRM
jgi:hypothetical protein